MFTVDNAPLGHRVHEQLLARLDQTERLLHDSAVTHEAAVHQSRKNMKWVRAVLRLIADGTGTDLREEECLCRDIGRRLCDLRDADVNLLTLREIVLASGGRIRRKDVEPFEHLLEARRARLLDAGAFDTAFVGVIRKEISELAADLARRPVPVLTPESVSRAIERTRAQAASVFAGLTGRTNPEQWHTLRKRTKREYHQRSVLPDPADGPRMALLEALGDQLGWQQDLEVLRRVAREHGFLTAGLGAEIARQLRNCRRRSRRLATRVHG
jgi:CHAD domain-containing protein